MIVYFIHLIFSAISIYELILLIRAVISWIPSLQDTRVYEIAYRLTEPLLLPIRKFLYRFEFMRRFPIDFSMIVLILLMGAFSRLLLFIMFI